ncbi:SDR family oxidoreductase [Streptomyces lincolnensis]|uniref:SDR family oxidoreductase n=1 Tax=Streptomyces lincolnensis TaxID=1915 RepID=UPI0037D424F2
MSVLSGLKAVVTGGASGIVPATSRMLVEDGAAVAVLDRDHTTRSALPYLRRSPHAAAVNPGIPRVPRLLETEDDPETKRATLDAHQPLGRLATADEAEAAVVSLAIPAAASVTGIALAVDGGMQGLRLSPAVGA